MKKLVCDEMVDPVLDERLREAGFEVYRPETSDSDEKVLKLASEKKAPIITRDRDFISKHRNKQNHYGIIYDPRMHHRTTNEVYEAVKDATELMDSKDLENTVIRLKRFY